MPLDQPLNSLGLPKAPADTRVVVAMSGGVDASVVAAILAEQGYDAGIVATEYGDEVEEAVGEVTLAEGGP
jgi:7-cyano-7-deazaguanine synthase in queuosine biosynthesis